MSEKVLEGVVVLNKSIERLLNDYTRLRADYDRMQAELSELSAALQEKESDYSELKRSYEHVKLTGALMGEGESAKEAKRRLNGLVREIDRCIALLNR